MKKKVFINGSAGTTGLRISGRLKKREDIELLEIPFASRKDPRVVREYTRDSDITFLCLPDGAAREAVETAKGQDVILIDTSTAHRTEPGWAYGYPELSPARRGAIRGGKRIAVPGCHATGFITLVYPLVAAGRLSPSRALSCVSLTGYSGGGKKMIAEYEGEGRGAELLAPREYGLSQDHKHLKEMRAVTGMEKEPLFIPIVSDYYSGMLVSVPLRFDMLSEKESLESVRGLYAAHFAGEKLIRVMPPGAREDKGGFLGSNNLSGRDGLEIFVSGNSERLLLSARFDNLGKGASGAAIQCLNILLGCEETRGLTPW